MPSPPVPRPRACVLPRHRERLEQAVRDPGFTPSLRDLDGLVDLLADEKLSKELQKELHRDVERAIRRLGPPALPALALRLKASVPPLRARLVRAVGRLVEDERARALLLEALADGDAKTRRNAVIALGHARGPEVGGVELALARLWNEDPRLEIRRSIAASLGKVGGPSSLPLLAEARGSADAELARIAGQATMQIERTASRPHRGRLEGDRVPPKPVEVEVSSRRGIESLLVEELAAAGGLEDARVIGPGRVRARLTGPMNALFRARTMVSFAFPLPVPSLPGGATDEDAIVGAAAGPEARALLSTWTSGDVRYRIAWSEGGHKRASAWRIAAELARREAAWVNDPTASLWELWVGGVSGSREVFLRPRALDDPRLWWREADVPAASHPTIAAALVRVAGARPDDVVWDPFVGSAAELVERALAGPYASLRGSDLDERALDAARRNLAAARVSAVLERADALVHSPPGVTLVLTNPPMGRRAARTKGLADRLDRFVEHAASLLVPGGRLVWMAPWPKRARAAGARAGLALEWRSAVDMGGFDAEMQRWRKRS